MRFVLYAACAAAVALLFVLAAAPVAARFDAVVQPSLTHERDTYLRKLLAMSEVRHS